MANFALQVANCLSQPAVTVKPSPARDGFAHRLPQFERDDAGDSAWRLTSMARPALAPLVQASLPPVNQPSAKARSPETREAARIGRGRDRAGAVEGGIGEIDRAARIAQIGIAGIAEDPADRLVEQMGEPADLGLEGGAAALDLAEIALAHQHALGWCRPS